MFIKPDYNLESIYAIDLEELKSNGIKNLLFDLDSTLMASKSAKYFDETVKWLDKVRKNFFIAVVSNNHDPKYIEKVRAVSDFPLVFNAKKPDIKITKRFMLENNLRAEETAFVGDRPLTDTLCGKRLGCTTILVDSITAKTEAQIVRLVRGLERSLVKR